ncbi:MULTISPECIES: type III pantothenate kinase [Ignavibacterium]|jgi:type III pantothenate kinase|uniref:type III pantothenate kinase n=1 Tax=Ignavibacterium TaxID=795750 RepID=UPI0025C310DC|nr:MULTISPECIES: type III pantothenate kinase [Ignavibacterium]MBI5662333.1 type III pantothenate kinase [Ignavibacterium album]
MIMTLDIGNTQIFGGVFSDEKIILNFRKSTRSGFSSDEIGIFLRQVLRENNIESELIKGIAVCSVVPDLVYSIRNGCIKYFNSDPFLLQPGIKTGLKIKYLNPAEVGADRIANSIAGIKLFPDKDIIIIDFGTATTFDVVTKGKEYLGGAIMPGLKVSVEALESKTAKLSAVELEIPLKAVGRTTKESIQSGLIFGQVGAIKELLLRIKEEQFRESKPVVIGTGGFSHMFRDFGLFDEIIPDLVLKGIYLAYHLNQ